MTISNILNDVLISCKEMGTKAAILNILKGMGIGIANVIPGVSGGTMAVIFGIYEKFTEAISNFITAPLKKKIEYGVFLGTIAIGMGLGIISFARLVVFSLGHYPKITALIFTLLILPSIPMIIKNEKKSMTNIISFVLGAVITAVFIILDIKYGDKNGALASQRALTIGYYVKLAICGAIAAGAMVIPGISGSLLLLIIGEYGNVMSFIHDWKIVPLIFFGIGMIVGLIGISKLINILLKKHRGPTLFFITGLVIVSIFQIWIKIAPEAAAFVSNLFL